MEFETFALQWNNCHLEFSTLSLQLPEGEANGWHPSEQNGDFGEFPFFAALHPENGGWGYCSEIVYAQLVDSCDLLWWATGWKIPFQSAVGRSPWLLVEMKEWRRCAESRIGFLCAVWGNKFCLVRLFFELTLATWAWKNKNNKSAPVGQRSWHSLVQN